jgi:hypothetical protein
MAWPLLPAGGDFTTQEFSRESDDEASACQESFISLSVRFAETARDDFIESAFMLAHDHHGDFGRLILGVTVHAGADARKRDGLDAVLQRQLQRVAVAIGE